MKNNKGWYLFHDWVGVLKCLEKGAAWEIIEAIDEYYLTGNDPTQAVNTLEQQVIVTMMYQQIQRLESVSAKRKSAGQEGGFAKAQNSKSKQTVANRSKSKQNVAKDSKAKQSVATYTYTYTNTNTNTNTTLTSGLYDNVVLSHGDLAKLKEEFPYDWEARIDRLSEYMATTGKTYKNHLATIRSWARREREEQAQREGSFDTDEFFEAACRASLGDAYVPDHKNK